MLPHPLVGWGGAAVAILLHASLALADSPEASLPPDRAVALALTAHPDLRAADAALATARASRSQSAGLLYNPSISGWSSPDGARASLGVSQPISLTGERWHARRGASLRVNSNEATRARTQRMLAARVRQAYVEAIVATGVVDVAHEGTDLASQLSFAVRRKYEEGEASALELRLARLSEVQAATRLLEARRVESAALRRLSALVMEPVSADDLIDDPLLVVPAFTRSDGSARSDVIAAEAALEATRAELRQARARAIPPVSLGAAVQVEDGVPYVGPSVGLTVPVFNRNQAGRAQAGGAVQVAEGRLAALRAQAETERRTSKARLAEAESASDVADADLDEARAALRSIVAGVLAGEIDLPTAILLQAQVLQGEAAVVTLQGQLALARLDRLLSLDDPALLGGAR